MKNLLFALIIILSVSCTKKDEFAPINNMFLVGQTYASSQTNASGYKFITESLAVSVFIGPNTGPILMGTVEYSGSYPNLKIGGYPATFLNENTFVINAVIMTKW